MNGHSTKMLKQYSQKGGLEAKAYLLEFLHVDVKLTP